tara:strand:- start:2018 stop:2680 length:663 start_codon:yes stop_codon:yes gene_type:complete
MDVNIKKLKEHEFDVKNNKIKIESFSKEFVEIYESLSVKKKELIKNQIENKTYQKKIILNFLKFSKEKGNSKKDSIIFGRLIVKLLEIISKLNLKTPKVIQEIDSKNKTIPLEFHKEVCKKIKEHYIDLETFLKKHPNNPSTLIITTTDSLMTIELSQIKLILINKKLSPKIIYTIDFKENVIKKNSIKLKYNQISKFESIYKQFAKYLAENKVKFAIKK